jgi:tetratricopeptide (TPR) repeat protein
LRSTGDYAGAEEAFREYVQLMPDEPNPLDSYAELLMKRGRFKESIDKYGKALEKNPEFVPSYIGIGNNLIFMEQPAEARKTFSLLGEVASNDSERRQAVFWTVVSFIHEGRYDEALEAAEQLRAMAYEGEDKLGASEALVLMGDILLETGYTEEAVENYHAALDAAHASGSPDELKRTAARNLMYHEARVALKLDDLENARTIANRYGDLVGEYQIPAERRAHRELVGLVALAEGDFDAAATHLEKADQDDPRVLYELALAHRGAGNIEKAKEFAERAAAWNGLGINFAYVRHKARELVKTLALQS